MLLVDSIKKDAASIWPQLEQHQRLDKTNILLALDHSPTLPPSREFELAFPYALRIDRDIVLGFARRPDFAKLYLERPLRVTDRHNSDYEIMLEYCRKIPASLKQVRWEHFPDKQARNLVGAAVSLDGVELQHAPAIAHQKEFFKRAITRNGAALASYPDESLLKAVTRSRRLMLKVVATCGNMIQMATPNLQQDKKIVETAVMKGGLEYDSLPMEVKRNTLFLKRLEDMAVKSVRAKGVTYDSIPKFYQRNEAFLLRLIESYSVVGLLQGIPPTIQRQHPSIALKSILVAKTTDLPLVGRCIYRSLWSTYRPLFESWIKRGAPLLQTMRGWAYCDRDHALLLVKHCYWGDFGSISSLLLSDRDFIFRAVQYNEKAFSFASSGLKHNFAVAVQAVVNHPAILRHMEPTWISWFQNRVASLVNNLNIFWAIHGSILNHDTDTNVGLRRLLASFLGVRLESFVKVPQTLLDELETCQRYIRQFVKE